MSEEKLRQAIAAYDSYRAACDDRGGVRAVDIGGGDDRRVRLSCDGQEPIEIDGLSTGIISVYLRGGDNGLAEVLRVFAGD